MNPLPTTIEKPRFNLWASFIIIALICLILFLDNILAYVALSGIALIGSYLLITRFTIPHLHLVYLLVITSILAPPIQIVSSLPNIRIDEFIIYATFPLVLFFNSKNLELTGYKKSFTKIYSFFILCAIVSLTYGYTSLKVPVSTRDFFEIVTIIKYLLLFLTISSFNLEIEDVTKILYVTLFTIVISGLFGLLQYFGIFGLDHITAPYYLDDRIHIVSLRLTATYKNPNTYAAILVLGHLIALGLFFFEKRRNLRPLLLLCIGLLAVFMLFAGSRTMLLAYIISTVLLSYVGAIRLGYNMSRVITLFAFIGIGFIIAISFISYEILNRLDSGVDFLSDTSLAMRFLAWYLNILLYIQSPWVGWGPAKDIHTTIVDNEFVLILRRYGIIGFISFLGFYIHPLIVSVKQLRIDDKIPLLLSIIVFSIIITFLIANLTNTLFHDNQVMDFWFIFLALFYTTISKNTNSEVSKNSLSSK